MMRAGRAYWIRVKSFPGKTHGSTNVTQTKQAYWKCVVALMVAELVAPTAAVAASGADEEAPARTTVEKMVDVGGYKLNFRHTPGILPAIVFECGGGGTATQWRKIQNALNETTQNAIVSYDRAGHGKSELPDTEYDVESEVAALRAGLEALGVADRVVLVGHSYAGFLITVYTHQYTDSVESLLYIDPNTLSYARWRGTKDDPTDFPNTKYGRAIARQLRGFPKTLDTVESIPLPTKPYFVISAGERWLDTEEGNDVFRRAHEELADANGTHLIIAEGVDHFVPRRAPELVIRVINDLLANSD